MAAKMSLGETSDPNELRIMVETIRQGIEGDFWRWLRARVGDDMTADLARLASPSTPVDQVHYLRGCIQARNDLLTLPTSVLAMYASNEEPEEDEPDIPAGRRSSPVPPEP